jgi:hypothetical protein
MGKQTLTNRQTSLTCRHTKYCITIEHRVGGSYRAGKTVVGHLGHLLGLRFGKIRVCGDHAYCGVRNRAGRRPFGQSHGLLSQAAELVGYFKTYFPRPSRRRIDDGTQRIDRDQSGHNQAGIQYLAGRSETSFYLACDTASARSHASHDSGTGAC